MLNLYLSLEVIGISFLSGFYYKNIFLGYFYVLLFQLGLARYTHSYSDIMIFPIFNNFIGLFPHIFTSTRHSVFTLTLAPPL